MNLHDIVTAQPDIISTFLGVSGTTIAVVTDENHRIVDCNANLPRTLHTPDKPVGRYIGDILCPMEDEQFSLLVSDNFRDLLPQMMRVCYTEILYKCYTVPAGSGFLLMGDRVGGTENEVLESMSLLNNELSVLSRELGRKNREIEKAYRKITELSRTDSLTGLANRGYFRQRCEEMFALSQRHRFPLSLVMIDLDCFKQINDNYGHAAGDSVLAAFGALVRENCREGDFPARYGGEEFIAFLPHTPVREALNLGDRLRILFSEQDILENGQTITISTGISEHRPGDSLDDLIKRADDALYQAKHQGRNRCVIL
ncbi:MAG: GGDEF domain-containing protein [Desulfobacterales bacterium]|nr:GGDEF domain-containing protein [Desulfobacterales bacterium]MBS3754523.1 GGDEF domain-containing protein [Desulfobacterales bacterium]